MGIFGGQERDFAEKGLKKGVFCAKAIKRLSEFELGGRS